MTDTPFNDSTEEQQVEPKVEQPESISPGAEAAGGVLHGRDGTCESAQVSLPCDTVTIQSKTTPEVEFVDNNADSSAALVNSDVIPARVESEPPGRPDVGEPASKCSERKLQANRDNAQKSTGPRTARGKHRSAQNALKHGALAKRVLYDAEGKLRSEDLAVLWVQMCEEYDATTVRGRLEIESLLIAYRRNLATIDMEDHLYKCGIRACFGREADRVHRYGVANQRAMLSLLEQLEETKREQAARNRKIDDDAELECDNHANQSEVGFDDPESADPEEADWNVDGHLSPPSTASHSGAPSASRTTVSPVASQDAKTPDEGSESAAQASDPATALDPAG